jgi:hypothetical protein
MKWVGHVERRMGEKNSAYEVLVGKPESYKGLGRPSRT